MTIVINKLVPTPMQSAYLDMGWLPMSAVDSQTSIAKTEEGLSEFQRTLEHNDVNVKTHRLSTTVSTPKLIPGIIRRPFGMFDRSSLETGICFLAHSQEQDYSIKIFQANYLLTRTYKTDISLVSDGRTFLLRVYGSFDSSNEYQQYVGVLKSVFKDKQLALPTMKPGSKVEINAPAPDFWWDVANHKFLSFDKNFMSRIDSFLKNTFFEEHKLESFDAHQFH